MSDELTPEELAVVQAHCMGFPEQNEDGIDLSLLRENLKLTPLERLLRMQSAARWLLEQRGKAGLPTNP